MTVTVSVTYRLSSEDRDGQDHKGCGGELSADSKPFESLQESYTRRTGSSAAFPVIKLSINSPTVQNETVGVYLSSINGNYDSNNVWIYDNTNATWIRASGSTQIQPGEALWKSLLWRCAECPKGVPPVDGLMDEIVIQNHSEQSVMAVVVIKTPLDSSHRESAPVTVCARCKVTVQIEEVQAQITRWGWARWHWVSYSYSIVARVRSRVRKWRDE